MVYETVVHERKQKRYKLTDRSKIHVFPADQKTITYRSMHELDKAATLDEITEAAEKNGFTSKRELRASVRFNVILLVKEGYAQQA